MNKKILSLLSLCCLANVDAMAQSSTQAGKQKVKPTLSRIINGQDAAANTYPFMTGLVRYDSDSIDPFCGASFVGGRYVLSASHCLVGSTADNLAVWIGGHDTQNPQTGRKVKVAQIYLHEEYDDSTLNNDVAILELVEEVTDVTPINLLTPEIEATLEEGFEFTVMGWGNTDTESPTFPNILQEVNVPLYNRAACETAYSNPDTGETDLTDKMLCAGLVEGGKDSCQGDSGGPLVLNRDGQWYQAGVVSFGNGCAEANNPGIYARVSQFIQWIEQKKAGVSYQQNTRNGYVEQVFDEQISFQFKNVGQQAYSITGLSLVDVNNLAPVEITSNQCDGQILNFEQSCDVTLRVVADQIGQAAFTLDVTTNHPVNPGAQLYFSMNTLERESLDLTSLVGSDDNLITWWGGGEANWQAQTDKVVTGDNAIASGDVTHFERSVLLATVESDAAQTLSLQYLVSSEDGYDFLDVLHNNRLVLSASGTEETEFAELNIDLKPGMDRIAIVYVKDASEDGGDDKAYVDDVKIGQANQAPVAQVAQTSLSVEEQGSFTLDASGSSDPEAGALTYNWAVVGDVSVNITDPQQARITLTAPEVSTETSLVFEVTVTDPAGESSKAQVTVTVQPKATTPPVTATPSRPSGGGGSFGFILALITALVVYRRAK